MVWIIIAGIILILFSGYSGYRAGFKQGVEAGIPVGKAVGALEATARVTAEYFRHIRSELDRAEEIDSELEEGS